MMSCDLKIKLPWILLELVKVTLQWAENQFLKAFLFNIPYGLFI